MEDVIFALTTLLFPFVVIVHLEEAIAVVAANLLYYTLALYFCIHIASLRDWRWVLHDLLEGWTASLYLAASIHFVFRESDEVLHFAILSFLTARCTRLATLFEAHRNKEVVYVFVIVCALVVSQLLFLFTHAEERRSVAVSTIVFVMAHVL